MWKSGKVWKFWKKLKFGKINGSLEKFWNPLKYLDIWKCLEIIWKFGQLKIWKKKFGKHLEFEKNLANKKIHVCDSNPKLVFLT